MKSNESKVFQLPATASALRSTNAGSDLRFDPDDTMSIAEMARWLRSDDPPGKGIQWVREKCRPRSPNPIPFKNLGRNLIFSRIEVSDWIRNTQPTVHWPHRRRRTTLHVMKKAA
jgi:hypothetical protein